MHEYLSFSIDWRKKDLPYAPEKRRDGENYGFKPIKGKLELVSLIKEAIDEPAYQEALKVINNKNTQLYSVGCEKCMNLESDGTARPIGFIEIAFNSIKLAKNVDEYFQLFLRLHKKMGENYNLLVGFEIQLNPVNFKDYKQQGYTAAIYIKLIERIESDSAIMNWRKGVNYLQQFLGNYRSRKYSGPYFYPSS